MQPKTPKDFADFEGEGIGPLTQRIERILKGAAVDCVCQERLHRALNRFSELEVSRMQRQTLSYARDQRLRIASILALMTELEDINFNEADTSVFTEMACLFDDVSNAAHRGAIAMRKLADTLT